MGFRKRNAKLSDNKSKSAVIMGKPASQLTKRGERDTLRTNGGDQE